MLTFLLWCIHFMLCWRTLEQDHRVAFNDPRHFVTAQRNLRPMTEWSPEMAAAVRSIEVVQRRSSWKNGHSDNVVQIQFWQVKALEL